MSELRYYQQDAVDSCLGYLNNNPGKNPILVLPTAAGKSHIISALCENTLQYAATRILVITHVKELIIQNHAKMPPALGAGIYSAGVGLRNTHNRVIFAGIQSIYKKAEVFKPVDLVLIDECHLLGPNQDTMYQTFLEGLGSVRVVGLTATPYRTKGGMLANGSDDSMFDDIAYDISVAELIKKNYLSPLKSKSGITQADLSQVKMTAGDYNKKGMAEAFDKDPLTQAAVEEINTYGKDRKSWLIFTSSVQHAFHIQQYIPGSAVITGETDPAERARLIHAHITGALKCLINYGVLTTGYDNPMLDMLVMLRATKSTGLYVQILGRGMRVSPETGKENCLVLDYGGNIERHGPVDAITIAPKLNRKTGDIVQTISIQPTKICPECRSDNHALSTVCGVCGYEYPIDVTHAKEASEAPVMAADVKPVEYTVNDMLINTHKSKKGHMGLKVTYVTSMGTFIDWVSVENPVARKHYLRWWSDRAMTIAPETVAEAIERQDEIQCPETISVRKENGYDRIIAYKGQKATAGRPEEVDAVSGEYDDQAIMW